jgi:DNA-binding transcriptional ArsR family regulator
MESGGKITLDQESFRALASGVRVEILKRLDTRRETVTDLSNLLALSKPTLLEHLEKLQSAGLVKRIDEGRKWIYYELSQKGRKILHPERVAITLALGAAVVLAAIGAFSLLLAGNPSGQAGNLRNLPAQPIAEPMPFVGADPLGFGLLLLVLSLTSVAVALALRFDGTRRRDRFFEQLRMA